MLSSTGIPRRLGAFAVVALVPFLGPGANATSRPAPGITTQMGADTVHMSAKNNSGITGTVLVEAKGDSTTLVVTLDGAKSGSSYPTHIHRGACTEPGSVVVPLTSVTVGANGTGTSRTTVATKTLEDARKAAGSILVQSHQPDGTPAACGVLPS
jgi:hypothetical protein